MCSDRAWREVLLVSFIRGPLLRWCRTAKSGDGLVSRNLNQPLLEKFWTPGACTPDRVTTHSAPWLFLVVVGLLKFGSRAAHQGRDKRGHEAAAPHTSSSPILSTLFSY